MEEWLRTVYIICRNSTCKTVKYCM